MSATQKFIVILLAAAIVGGTVQFARVAFRPPAVESGVPWVRYVHPNVARLKKARGLSEEGKLPEARQVLIEALTSAPQSPVTQELRDLLGEINTRLFFGKNASPRKTDYIVARGDALSSIARKLRSSTDVIMRVNDLDSTMIRPGEKLIVPRIDFTITIDLPHDRVVVHDGHGFFTQYPVASAELPPSRAFKVETKVRAKTFLADGQPVSSNDHEAKRDATPWIFLHRGGYVIYGVEEASEETDAQIEVEGDEPASSKGPIETDRPPQGIAMLKKDIAELDLLIRKGTPVTIIRNRKSL